MPFALVGRTITERIVAVTNADGIRLLLIDDEASVCEVIGDIIAAFAPGKVDLTCVNSDTAAYRAFAEGPPYDLIFVDINLGRGTTGYDVARRARSIYPDVEVIYISGQIDQQSVATFGVEGSTFLAKPFTSQQLLAAIGVEPLKRAV